MRAYCRRCHKMHASGFDLLGVPIFSCPGLAPGAIVLRSDGLYKARHVGLDWARRSLTPEQEAALRADAPLIFHEDFDATSDVRLTPDLLRDALLEALGDIVTAADDCRMAGRLYADMGALERLDLAASRARAAIRRATEGA